MKPPKCSLFIRLNGLIKDVSLYMTIICYCRTPDEDRCKLVQMKAEIHDLKMQLKLAKEEIVRVLLWIRG